MEKKDKKITGSKSVIINAALHASLKNHCVGSSRKMGGVIENLIKLYLSDIKKIQEEMDNLTKSN